ncbi:MAG: peptidylprolyl isomerase [Phycisphaerales bacterium]
MSTQTSKIRRLGTPTTRWGRGPGARGAVVALLGAGTVLALPGCDSGDSTGGPVLTAADFRTPGAEAPAPENGNRAGTIKPTAPKSPLAGAMMPTQPVMPPGEGPVTMSPETASQGVGDVAVLVGERENKGDPNAKPTKEEFVVDTMVGQINGRPVFANQFFQETRLDGLLRAALYDTVHIRNAADWRAGAKYAISENLKNRMRDELFLAEARSMLTPEEKKGLLNFISHLRENLASAARGSAIAAEDELKSTDNTTLDDKAKNERDILLLRLLSARYIEPHINVSWRDVQKQYERDFAAYNPPAEAYLRMIWVAKKNNENVEKVRAALAEGESFVNIAKGPMNEFDRDKGGALLPPRKIDTTYAQTKLVGFEAVNAAAQKLKPGEFAGPIENRTDMVWIYLEKIDQPPGRNLEDAQLQLEILTKLLTARQRMEQEKFRLRLMERGSKVEEGLMIDRLVAIAQERFLDNGQFPKAVLEERARITARPPRPGASAATPPGGVEVKPPVTPPSAVPPGTVIPPAAPEGPRPILPPPPGNAPPANQPPTSTPPDPNMPGKQP